MKFAQQLIGRRGLHDGEANAHRIWRMKHSRLIFIIAHEMASTDADFIANLCVIVCCLASRRRVNAH